MSDVDRVLEAVTQADDLWQHAVKQMNDNDIEGTASVFFCFLTVTPGSRVVTYLEDLERSRRSNWVVKLGYS